MLSEAGDIENPEIVKYTFAPKDDMSAEVLEVNDNGIVKFKKASKTPVIVTITREIVDTTPDKCIEAAMETHPYFQMKREERCNSCPWFCYCKGGCTVHIKTQGKEPPAVDDIECASNRKLYPLMVEWILNHKEEVNAFLQEEVL